MSALTDAIYQNTRGNSQGYPAGLSWDTGVYGTSTLTPAPSGFSSLTGWGVVYPEAGAPVSANAASDTVQISNYTTYVHLTNGSWVEVQNQPQDGIGGAHYVADFSGNANVPWTEQKLPDGSVSVDAPQVGYNDHFWPGVRGTYTPGTVDGVFIEANMKTNDASANLVAQLGADWWRSPTAQYVSGFANNPVVGGSNFTKLTTQWQTLYYTSLSPQQLQADPPPGLQTASPPATTPPPPATTPAVTQVVASSSAATTPVSTAPTAPTTPVSTAPTSTAPTTPTTPVSTDPTTPVSTAPTTPTTPVSTDPTTPVSTDPTTPASTAPTTPTTPTTPVSTDPTTPVSTAPTTPTTPVSTDPTTPVSTAPTTPTTPVSTNPTTPASTPDSAHWFGHHPDFAPVATTLSDADASKSAATPNGGTAADPVGSAGAKSFALFNQMMAGDFDGDSHFAPAAMASSSGSPQQSPHSLTRPLH
jgi:hypothetical protein